MVKDLIRRARRRLLLNETLGQAAFAGAVMAGGFALILLLGTRYLEWWTLALFAVAGAAAGVARGWRNSPGVYATALRVDSSARLNDAISTALHFESAAGVSAEFRKAQREQAENAARGVLVEEVIPFTRPKALYALAALGAFAALLIGLRFAVGHGLDLSRPITEVLFEDQAAQRIAKKQAYMDPARRAKLEAAESLLAKLGAPVNPDDKGDPEAALDKAIQDALEGNTAASGEKGEKGKGGKQEDGKAGTGLSQELAGDPMQDKKAEGGEQSGGDSKQQGGQKGSADDKGKTSGGDSNNQSLMSKLKDAVKDLLNNAGKQNSNSGEKGDKQQSAKSEKSDEKGSSGKPQDQQSQETADAQAGEPNGDSQEGKQSEGKAGSKSSQSSAQAGTGMGSQDGAKELRAAEQLKAMGKISEIIGKRSQTVTGETSIEVQSGSQQLRTAYSNKQAAHGEAESDVARDEIPVALHSYVQQYFEQVRKAAPPKGKAAENNK